jgi:transcription antitermination protein NusB
VGARSKARRRALEILFEADQRGHDPLDVLGRRRAAPDIDMNPYTGQIVEGVVACQERIDELIATYAHGWTMDRMPGVDRAILRLGVWELLYNDDVPDAVAVDEAVDLAREMSTEESPGFVNGLLGRLLQMKPSIVG